MMRVLFLAPQPFFRERGTPIRARNILTGLSEAGHQVDVLCYPFGSPVDIPGVRLLRIPRVPFIHDMKIGPSWAKVPLDFLMFLSAIRLCLRNRYEVIEAIEEAAFLASWLKGVFKTRLIYNMDSHLSDHLAYSGFLTRGPLLHLVKLLESRTMKHADLVVTVCESLSKTVREQAPGTAVLQLEDAPLQEVFEEQREEAQQLRGELGLADRSVVLYTGNFGMYQGLDLLLDAAADVVTAHPEVAFVLVGGKIYQVDLLKKRAKSLGIEKNILFVGTQMINRIPAFITLSNLLVSPRTRGTNTPLKIYDYMQSGRPIVATDLPTHTQALDESCAFLAPAEPKAFAKVLVSAMEDQEGGQARAQAAKIRLEERYSLRLFKERIRAAYRSLDGHGFPLSRNDAG